MMNVEGLPVGSRVRARAAFEYEGVNVARGELGVITTEGEGCSIKLDRDHRGLEDNSIFLPPSWMGLEDAEAARTAFVPDRIHGLRKAFQKACTASVMLLVSLGMFVGSSVSDLIHEDPVPRKTPDLIVRHIVDERGVMHRVVLRRVRDGGDDRTKDVWQFTEIDRSGLDMVAKGGAGE